MYVGVRSDDSTVHFCVWPCRACTSVDITDSNCSPVTLPQLVLAAEITCEFLNWVVFPFLICSVIVSDPALNQPTQSDCLDFVLCILFSYTPLFLPLLKVYSTKINFFVCDVAEADLFFKFFVVCLAFSTH